jgi:hypothetical protein
MTNEYQMKKHEEAMATRVNDILKAIASFEKFHRNLDKIDSPIQLMTIVEDCLVSCGSEPKPHFLEVSTNFVQVYTLVKMNANLYPFFADDHPQNDRFHKVVTQTLLGTDLIESVKWLPKENGSILLVTRRV